MKKSSLFFLLIFFLTPFILKSQELCTENLIKANAFYEKGNFSEAITLASACTNSEMASNRWKAFRLLAMSYLASNQKEKALDAAENMLKLNPTYKPNSLNDPGELIQMLKKITVLPKFNIGLAFSIGPNATFPKITSVYTVNDCTKQYLGKNSFMFGISTGYNFTKNVGLELAVLSSTKSYEIKYSFTDWTNKVAENLTYIDIPLNIKYTLPVTKKIYPFIQVGGYAGYLLFSMNDFRSNYIPKNQAYELLNVSSLERRNRFNFGLTGGIGINYLLDEAVISLRANYFYSFANIVKAETRYRYNELLYTHYYIDDDIYLNNLAISFGYAFNLNYKVLHKR